MTRLQDSPITLPDIQRLKEISRDIRVDIVRSLEAAGSGHLGGSLGLADIFTALYFHILTHRPEEPAWPMRDRLILSIGHVAPVYYAALAHSGYFPKEELLSLRKLGSRLQGHPGRDHGLPGLELSAGSLGQGLSVAVGMALAAKLDGMKWKVVCIMGDGEMQEGSIWEAGMSAAHHQLGNLIGIIDRNYCQIDGPTRDVMDIEPLQEKWKSFGWHVHSCDGNEFASIISTWNRITSDESTQPHMIIARTAMGKGVSDIENDYRWHGKAPNQEQANHFIRQIIENHEQSL